MEEDSVQFLIYYMWYETWPNRGCIVHTQSEVQVVLSSYTLVYVFIVLGQYTNPAYLYLMLYVVRYCM